MKDLTKLVEKTGDALDKNITTGEERQAQISDRHKVDMMSDSWLSKNVRPIAFLSSLVAYFLVLIVIVILAIKGLKFPDINTVFTGVSGLTLTYGSFYFYRRSSEKIAAKNADTNMKMEEMKLKQELKLEKKRARREMRKR